MNNRRKIEQHLIPILQRLVSDIAAGNYEELSRDGRIGRVTHEELSRAIVEYGATIVEIPDEGQELAEVYPIKGKEKVWAIDLPLWTEEEGESDLTLSVTVEETSEGKVQVEIDDCHVL